MTSSKKVKRCNRPNIKRTSRAHGVGHEKHIKRRLSFFIEEDRRPLAPTVLPPDGEPGSLRGRLAAALRTMRKCPICGVPIRRGSTMAPSSCQSWGFWTVCCCRRRRPISPCGPAGRDAWRPWKQLVREGKSHDRATREVLETNIRRRRGSRALLRAGAGLSYWSLYRPRWIRRCVRMCRRSSMVVSQRKSHVEHFNVGSRERTSVWLQQPVPDLQQTAWIPLAMWVNWQQQYFGRAGRRGTGNTR